MTETKMLRYGMLRLCSNYRKQMPPKSQLGTATAEQQLPERSGVSGCERHEFSIATHDALHSQKLLKVKPRNPHSRIRVEEALTPLVVPSPNSQNCSCLEHNYAGGGSGIQPVTDLYEKDVVGSSTEQ